MSSSGTPKLSQLNVFPVKSIAGISQSQAWVEKQGMAFDRRFMVAKPSGDMVTARKYPQMVKVKAALLADGLVLSYGDKSHLSLKYKDFLMQDASSTVWADTFIAYTTTDQANAWFSDIIGEPVQLLFTLRNFH